MQSRILRNIIHVYKRFYPLVHTSLYGIQLSNDRAVRLSVFPNAYQDFLGRVLALNRCLRNTNNCLREGCRDYKIIGKECQRQRLSRGIMTL